VLKDFKSGMIDFNDQQIYRDLGVPIGAINKKRLGEFKKRYDETPPDADKFLYGSHFSCPGYVIGFHVRQNP